MGLIASVYARLCRPEAVRVQVLAHLFLARVHNSIKSSYEQYLATSSSSSSSGGRTGATVEQSRPRDWQLFKSELHQNGLPAVLLPPSQRHHQDHTALTQLTQRRQRTRIRDEPDDGKRAKLSLSRSRDNLERDNHAPIERWSWRGFPSLWRPLAVYEIISIGWMSLASLRTIFQEQLDALAGPASRWLLNGRPGNCLLMGRIVKPLNIGEYSTVLVASWHLGWRLVQARAERSRLITMIVFLLASERDLANIYASFAGPEDKQFTRPDGHRLMPDDDDHDHAHDDDHDHAQARLLRWTNQLAQPPAEAQVAGQNERLFRQVMCYQVHQNQRIHFRLRPNRTRGARKLLMRRVAAVSFVTIIFFALEFCFTLTVMLTSIFSDYRYARAYPGCDRLLDARLARDELTYFSSFTLRGHHLASACVDIAENLIFWLDSGMSLTFVPAFCYMLNYDLLLYWSELNRKLELLAQRSKHAYLFQVQPDESVASGGASSLSPVSSAPCRLESMRALESDIHELQFEMFDFFHQIRRADLIVGDTLTHAILIWLVGCAFVNYNVLMYEEDSLYMSVFIELILILGFFVISLATFHLLELRRRCLRSYRTLCTLMAYDRTRKKRSFIKLMDFYLGARNSITYHLVRTYAYEPTTFITIIGWSFSCFFIAFTLFKPHGYAA